MNANAPKRTWSEGDGLVSVIIPCYNAAKFIGRTLDSAYSQRGVSLEVVLVDDGCTDDSVGVVKRRYPNTAVFRHENGANRGYARSVALAVSKARGEFIAFLDADDLWLSGEYLLRQVDELRRRPECVLSLMNGFAIDQDDNILWKWNDESVYKDFDKRSILQNCFMLTGATVVRREALLEAGGVDVALQAIDHDMWIRLSELGDFAVIPEPLFGYRQHPGQISHRRKQWEDGFAIMRKTAGRGFYSPGEIRRRKAVLHYRLAQHDLATRRYLSLAGHCLAAVACDPQRAFSQAWRFLLRKLRG